MKQAFQRSRVRLTLCLAAALVLLGARSFTPDSYLEHIKILASEEMRGRGTGTSELDRAAEYIARQFESYGLKPVVEGSYFQHFPVTLNAKLGPANRFRYQLAGRRYADFKSEVDFIPFNFSAEGEVSGEVVFAGYGITAAEYAYDDYAGLDVTGKIVLVLRHEPQEFDEKSVFAGKVYTEHSQFFSKATNAKLRGAKAVLLVGDTAAHSGNSDSLEAFGATVGPANAGLPFLQVRSAVVRKWFEHAGKDFDGLQREIDEKLEPRSFAFPSDLRVTLHADLVRETRDVANVVGYLPGETDEYVVVGAHYDHLGLGEQFSLAPSKTGTPHLGADDNASGTAGVLELARWYSASPRPRRGILFMAYAGEELGLLGSSFYVNNPALPIDKAVAMINMDMIGRVRDGKLFIGGTGTGSTFSAMLKEEVAASDLKVDFSEATGYGSSDHTSFNAKQVPVLFFFSGLHEDYHKPSDTWDKINAPAAAQVLDLIGRVTGRLLEGDDKPLFVRVRQPHGAHGGGPVGSSSAGGGYGPYFGSIPDFAEVPNGVRFSDVREDSPAARAGLAGGDILFEFDGKPIQNLYDFTYALRAKQPGDEVQVKVRRGDGVFETLVTLAQRK